MRNFSLMVFILAVSAVSIGQITITSSDMPQPDVTYPLVNAAITDLTLTDLSGANVTWDASGLVSLGEAPLTPVDINDASISAAFAFNSPFNSAYQCDFFLPTEFPDLGVDLGIPLDGFNNFYQTDGDAYTIAGIGLSASGFDLPVPYDDIDEIIPLPLNFGDEMTSTAAFELDITGILSYGLDQERQVVADGWGTLILPSGAYDVIRTRTELTATDDIFIEQLGDPFTIDREQVTYQWWGQGMGFPLLEIIELAGLSVIGTFQDFESTNEVAQSSLESGDVAYPNPAHSGQWIQWNETQEWMLMDLNGREICFGQAKGFTVPETLSNGTYLLQRGMQTSILVIE